MYRPPLGARMLVALVLLAELPVARAGQPGETVAAGGLEGRGGHSVSGTVAIVATQGGFQLVLQEDFRLDGAPDPRIALGRNGYDANTQFSRLRENSGRQVYELPQAIDPTGYTQVWLWCEAFSVPLGVAELR